MVLLTLFFLSACHDRWKFYPIHYNNGKILYSSKIPGMLVKDIQYKDLLNIDNDILYNFYIEYNGSDIKNRLLRYLINIISYIFAYKKEIIYYYWASQTVDSCNFSEISIALFNKLPSALTENEIFIIIYILKNKISNIKSQKIKILVENMYKNSNIIQKI